jgi:quercetin 2,3-dioxygenase
MASTRTLQALHEARRDDIGDLQTRRPVPGPTLEHLDPFLFLNHHGPQTYPPGNQGLPFGPHPHRGFETVTFILEGELAHRDSGGHESVIRGGGVQWMTAGRGLVHSELSPPSFLERGGELEILQLWVNLPARLKFTEPRYVGLQRQDIPEIPLADGKGAIQLIAGRIGDARGPMDSLTGVHMTTVTLEAGGRAFLEVPASREVFLYVVRGRVRIGDDEAPAYHLAELGREADAVDVAADEDSVLIVGHAEPIGEPIVKHGPFVMNTRDEIIQAIRDFEGGRF